MKKWNWIWFVLLTKQLKQHIQCWPLIGQAVVEEAGKEEVDAKKTHCEQARDL